MTRRADRTRTAKILFHKGSALAWAAFGALSFYMGWQNNVALVWMASVYANVKSDWTAAEAADDRAVVAEMARLAAEVRRTRAVSRRCGCRRGRFVPGLIHAP